MRPRQFTGTTLPRSGQNRTFSYYANRSQSDYNLGRDMVANKPPLRRLPGRVQRLRRHFGWVLLVVLVVGGIGYELQLSTEPKVVSTVQAAEAPFLQDNEVYAQAASKMLNGSSANRNKLTIDASGIAAQLDRQFPELAAVTVSLPLIGGQPVIYITPATPVIVLEAADSNYILDANGRAVAKLTGSQSAATLHVPVVQDQSGSTVTIGQLVVPKSVVGFIATVGSQLKSQSVAVSAMTLPVEASELDVHITGQPYLVKFNLHAATAESAQLQAGTYVAVSKQLTRQGKTPSQYVDVRLQGRAYFQ
jgi:cell division septal protein FtsQ